MCTFLRALPHCFLLRHSQGDHVAEYACVLLDLTPCSEWKRGAPALSSSTRSAKHHVVRNRPVEAVNAPSPGRELLLRYDNDTKSAKAVFSFSKLVPGSQPRRKSRCKIVNDVYGRWR